jgi:hypothetical protein
MAVLLDPSEPEVAAAIESTREILERLGARPYLEKLEVAAARQEKSIKPAPSTTAAETEVQSIT